MNFTDTCWFSTNVLRERWRLGPIKFYIFWLLNENWSHKKYTEMLLSKVSPKLFLIFSQSFILVPILYLIFKMRSGYQYLILTDSFRFYSSETFCWCLHCQLFSLSLSWQSKLLNMSVAFLAVAIWRKWEAQKWKIKKSFLFWFYVMLADTRAHKSWPSLKSFIFCLFGRFFVCLIFEL